MAVPDLPVKDIASYFSEAGVEITPADILRPAVANTQRIYECILQLLQGPSTPPTDESLQVLRLVQRMSRFLAKIGISNFTVRDLAPDSRRFVQILSTIINFAMYRDNKQYLYEQVSKIADDNYNTREELQSKIHSVQDEIATTKEQLEDNLLRKTTLEEENKKLESELRELYRHQKDKSSEVALLKAEKAEINDKLCSCQLVEHNIQQEIVCLKAQIVSDPGKLLELVKEMRELIEKERETIKATEMSLVEKSNKLQKAEKFQEFLQKIQVISAELRLLDEKIEQIEQAGMLQESKLKNQESAINAIKIRISHAERQISHIKSKISNLQTKDKQYTEEISEKMANLRIKYEDVSGERERVMNGVRENNKKVQELMNQQMIAKSDFDRECAEVIALLVQLSSDIMKYFGDVNNCLE